MRLSALLQDVLDIILPRRERTRRAENYCLADLKMNPATHHASGIEITTLVEYKNCIVEDCIRALKYDGSKNAGVLLATALADYLREEIAHLRSFSPRPIVLIPIPLHKERRRERGFNQVEKILEHLPPEFKNGTLSRIETSVLIRSRVTPPQTHMSRVERLKNLAGAFALTNALTLKNAHVILIDDVTTTGATLFEAKKTLDKTGAIVTPLALARA